MLHRRKLLEGLDLNIVQEMILSRIIQGEFVEEYQEVEKKLENDYILFHRPEIIEEWLKGRQETRDQGFDEIVNLNPEDLEEYEAAERMFRQADMVLEDIDQARPITDFYGVATELLGEEDA